MSKLQLTPSVSFAWKGNEDQTEMGQRKKMTFLTKSFLSMMIEKRKQNAGKYNKSKKKNIGLTWRRTTPEVFECSIFEVNLT